MRVVAGNLGGRQFASPHGHNTHPMSEKIRGALFNALGGLEGLTVLDAFAGSGALSFEAVSRGADAVVAIDSDASAQRTIAENIRSLGIAGKVKLIKAAAGSWLSTSAESFDVVLCDPPYENIQASLIGRLAERTKPGGLAVVSLPPGGDIKLGDDFELLSNKDYGDSQLFFYRRAS